MKKPMFTRHLIASSLLLSAPLAADALAGNPGMVAAAPQNAPNTMKPMPMSNMGEDQSDSNMAAGYNMPGRVNVGGTWDFWGNASFIYWQVRPDGLAFGISTEKPFPAIPPLLPQNQKNVYFHHKFKPGFKVGVGMSFPVDDWSLGAEYTFLRGTQHQSIPSSDTTAPWLPVWQEGGNSGQALSSRASWHYHFDIVDAMLSRAGYFGKGLILTPYIGARFFINQQRVITHSVLDISSLFIDPFAVTTHTTTNAWELGPRGGVNGAWLLGGGLKLLGNVALSLLYADFHSHHREVGAVALHDENLTAARFANEEKIFTPNLDLSVGFDWGTYVNQNKQHVNFSAKYDFLCFWNNNRLASQNILFNVGGLGVSNLTLAGLTFTAQLDF